MSISDDLALAVFALVPLALVVIAIWLYTKAKRWTVPAIALVILAVALWSVPLFYRF